MLVGSMYSGLRIKGLYVGYVFPKMLGLGVTWFAEFRNICRIFELLKGSQLSCSRIAEAWASLLVSAWENIVQGMCHLFSPDNWHLLENGLALLIHKIRVCLNIQCWIPGMICYIIHVCSYVGKYEASFSATWLRAKTIMWSLWHKK